MTTSRKRIDHRKDTEGLKLNLVLTERGKKGHYFTGGKKGSKTLGQRFEDRISFLSAEIQIANGDRFHAVINISPDDSGEHYGTIAMLPTEMECCVCKKSAERWPDIEKGTSYYIMKGQKFFCHLPEYIKKMGFQPHACPVCNGTGKDRYIRGIDLHHEMSDFLEATGLTRADVFPYRYRYYSHEVIQAQVEFHDHHVDEDTGWSTAGDDKVWAAYVEKHRAVDRKLGVGAEKKDAELRP